MNLLYVAESAIPSRTANSVHVMKMCQAISDIGHDVTLLVPDRPSAEERIHGSVHSFYNVRQNFEIEKLPFPGSSIPGPSGPLGFGLATAYRTLRVLPDLVYGRSLIGCSFAAAVGRSTMFETHVPGPTSDLEARLFPWLLRSPRFQKLVVISDALRDHYSGRFRSLNDRIVVSHDGADPIEGDPIGLRDVRPDRNGDALDVGYVGNLYEGKGIEVISEIADDSRFADFHIIGGYDEDVSYWKREMGNQANVCFYGFQPHSRAMGYLQSLDVAVAPYQRAVKGVNGGPNLAEWMSPLKLFEYMAAGRAIVSSDLPVLREILTDEETALLVDPDSPDAWVSALRRLSEDEPLRRELGANAKAQFERKHSWKRRAERLIEESG